MPTSSYHPVMGYPGHGYPGNPNPDQPNNNGGYGLTGHAREIYEARQRTIAYGANPHLFDGQVGEAAFAHGDMAAVEQAQAFASQAVVEQMRRQQRPAMPQASRGQQSPAPRRPSDATVQQIRALRQELSGSSYDEKPVPVRKLPRSREWIRTLGQAIMVISFLPAFASLVHASVMMLFIPAFFLGLILFWVGDWLEGRRIALRR
jgi:hypothetical protein